MNPGFQPVQVRSKESRLFHVPRIACLQVEINVGVYSL